METNAGFFSAQLLLTGHHCLLRLEVKGHNHILRRDIISVQNTRQYLVVLGVGGFLREEEEEELLKTSSDFITRIMSSLGCLLPQWF